MPKIEFKPNTTLMPVPVVLVSCQGADEKPNIITIAWTGVISSVPPMASISIRPSRHSHSLIKESSEFAINIPNEKLLFQADQCGSVSGRDVNKFEELNLTPIKASQIKAPLISECPINMECKVSQIINLGSHDLFIAEIVALQASDWALTEGKIDTAKVKPIAYAPHDYWSLKEKIGTYGFSQKSKP